jgi:ribose/xylose/arabinose/galactoside ABC-type transport system permease subunit
VAPELEPYVVVVRGPRAQAASRGERTGPSTWQLTLTTASMVAVVNGVVIGACAGLLLETLDVGSLALTLAAGVISGLAILSIQRHHHRRAHAAFRIEATDRAAILLGEPGG